MLFHIRLNSEMRRKEAKTRWKKIAKRRNKIQRNTLGANFRKNFIKLQDVIKDDKVDEDAEVTFVFFYLRYFALIGLISDVYAF